MQLTTLPPVDRHGGVELLRLIIDAEFETAVTRRSERSRVTTQCSGSTIKIVLLAVARHERVPVSLRQVAAVAQVNQSTVTAVLGWARSVGLVTWRSAERGLRENVYALNRQQLLARRLPGPDPADREHVCDPVGLALPGTTRRALRARDSVAPVMRGGLAPFFPGPKGRVSHVPAVARARKKFVASLRASHPQIPLTELAASVGIAQSTTLRLWLRKARGWRAAAEGGVRVRGMIGGAA